MTKKHLLAATCALMVLAGCGGDGQTPTPTPGPTPSPTPTPTPTPAPASFPLDGQEIFPLSFYALATTGVAPGTGQPEYPPQLVSLTSAGDRTLTLGIDQSTNWGLAIPQNTNLSSNFTPARAPAGGREIEVGNPVQHSSLTLLNNFIPNERPSESAFQFSYASYAFWFQRNGFLGAAPNLYGAHLFGYPTVAGSIPVTGTRNYASVFRSEVYTVRFVDGPLPNTNPRGQQEGGGTVFTLGNVAVDLANRAISFNVVIEFKRDPAAAAVATTFNGSGALSADRSLINGTLTSTDGLYSGAFTGTFYGPNGAEIGLVFGVGADISSGGTQRQQRIWGVILGR